MAMLPSLLPREACAYKEQLGSYYDIAVSRQNKLYTSPRKIFSNRKSASLLITMPGAIEQREALYKKISIRELHLTFGAEISGVDFSSPLPEDVFAEILSAITKVCYPNSYSCGYTRYRY